MPLKPIWLAMLTGLVIQAPAQTPRPVVLGAVAFSRDGLRIATTSWNAKATVWDTTTGKQLVKLLGHKGPILDVSFSPDGRRIVTASSDDTIRIWEVNTGREIARYPYPDVIIEDVSYSPNGSRILSSSIFGSVRVWDALTGRQLIKLNLDGVISAAFSPDGSRILTSTFHCAQVWNTSSGKEVLRITPGEGACYTPDGRRILSTTYGENAVSIWNSNSGAKLRQIRIAISEVKSLACSPDGSRFVVTGFDDKARVYDIVTGKELFTLEGTYASFSSDGLKVATLVRFGTKIWDAKTGREILRLASHGAGR
jgi:WD40 repeat protein